ncbi:glycoside hydrolase family 47 protein [Bipolaris oryzae ATCC 44560]|uniref:alpha-1,2-Mannosidase n=1 Tax=Bipolaris oryzae ATCC 44560 TaxID=930090 RepID=W6ZEE5_COCMI|nr:glycoside hydrolase family 47 protein [Bipolaris oryzae ATCC 44560]EUC45879.1 glycoside hydrolase family 47 protein [Bipolaris oryzae ATCC 44560]
MADQTTMLSESLENFWIMGLTKEFEEAVAAMTEINLEPHDQMTSLPQMTRLLYSLLSAYDLQKCRNSRVLDKALELGDMLYTFFDTSSRLPITSWNATKVADGEEQESSGSVTLAELTTYNLAFIRLSQLTGDMRFYDAATRVTNILESQQSSTKIPGLWPAEINLHTLDLTSADTFNVDASSGPAYAQHTLMTRLLATAPKTSPYTTMSANALDAIIQHILFRPVTPTNESVMMASPAYTSQRYHITLTHNLDISSCTLGSTLALSAALTHNDTHLTYARLLTEGCIWTTLHSPPSFNGNMMPKNFSMLACSSSKLSNSDEDCSFDPSVWPEQEYPGFEKIWDKKGPSVRPEVVMSLFALYRVTGEERWREVGWQMWEGVERVMEEKVEQALNGDFERDDEDFRMTMQTLKYFYLLFSRSDMLSLDEWVFGSDGGILWTGNV